uniref:Reverse transcriptase domain-containing protein n=1 Tax=Leptobrachium leishanense TaxID=445787 RepID=A0A8C5PPU1_9ANUR
MERLLRKLNYSTYTQGNKAGKWLASKLKAKRLHSKITQISSQGGTPVQNPKLIVSEFSHYYKNLYNLSTDPKIPTPKKEDISSFLEEANLPKLTLSQQSAPGPDGFTNLYYRKFASFLTPILTVLFNHIKLSGEIPSEMLVATVVTIPKPGKPSSCCENYRLISLLNVDIKHYSKLLASRIGPLLPSLIQLDQTGFVQGRQTCDNTRRFFNIIDLAHRTNEPGLLLSLDAEKAFDCVHYMHQTLAAFEFPDLFIKSIMALYTTPSAKVFNMGFLSPLFCISNGARQGCPLSPLIFVLTLEPLASHIRLTSSISGLLTPVGEQKLALFADDILLYLSSPETS